MKLYGGIDLHSNNSVVVLINEESKEIARKRLPNDLNANPKLKIQSVV